jgi:hypothetical protein
MEAGATPQNPQKSPVAFIADEDCERTVKRALNLRGSEFFRQPPPVELELESNNDSESEREL